MEIDKNVHKGYRKDSIFIKATFVNIAQSPKITITYRYTILIVFLK